MAKHEATDSRAAGAWCDVHAAEFHPLRTAHFKSEHADELPVANRYHKATLVFGVVSVYSIDFFGEGPFYIVFERITHFRRSEGAVDRYEQCPHRGVVGPSVGTKFDHPLRSLGLMKT